MSQKTEILDLLKRGPVTPMDALSKLGCFRLAARVQDLRDDGYAIRTEMIETPSGKHVARYELVQRPC